MKIKIYGSIIVIFLLTQIVNINLSYSQVSLEWTAIYNSSSNRFDEPTTVKVDKSGNVYVTGASSPDGTQSDFLTVKYNSSGVEQWTRRYNGSGNSTDYARKLVIDDNGNIYVAGESTGLGTGIDYCIIKYSSNGGLVWERRYDSNSGSSYPDFPIDLKLDKNGNVYVTGQSWLVGNYDYLTIKYDSNGVQKWVKRYNGPGNALDGAISLSIDKDNSVFITGASYGIGTGSDICTIKYDSNGVQKWLSRYTDVGNEQDQAVSLNIDISGNVIVTGDSYRTASRSDFCTIKYNSSGTQLWVKKFDKSNYSDYASSVLSDSANNIYVTGACSNASDESNMCTIKYTPSGEVIWNKDLDSIGMSSSGSDLVIDNQGKIYISGRFSTDNVKFGFCTIKYDTNGVLLWKQIYYRPGGGNISAALSITLDSNKNVYVTGPSYRGSAYDTEDYMTIKYSQPPPSISIQLKLLLEGFYSTVLNQMARKDSVKVYLIQAVSPYNKIDSAIVSIDSTTYSGTFQFFNAPSGSYYIVAKHLNCLETWSKEGGEILTKNYLIYNYDFTNSVTKAYGNNLQKKGTRYCFYSGDINQDGTIDATDICAVDNSAYNSNSGLRLPTDLNGDNIVNSSDIEIVDSNSSINKSVIRP